VSEYDAELKQKFLCTVPTVLAGQSGGNEGRSGQRRIGDVCGLGHPCRQCCGCCGREAKKAEIGFLSTIGAGETVAAEARHVSRAHLKRHNK